jgi:hypothetical protein
MAKKVTIGPVLYTKLSRLISEVISLNRVKEFNVYNKDRLFHEPPEGWNELENSLCEYQVRIQSELMDSIQDTLEGKKLDAFNPISTIKRSEYIQNKNMKYEQSVSDKLKSFAHCALCGSLLHGAGEGNKQCADADCGQFYRAEHIKQLLNG